MPPADSVTGHLRTRHRLAARAAAVAAALIGVALPRRLVFFVMGMV
ncbi:MAG: hypothetical protein ACRDKL_10490 [Solirubrobacteraceae bacterium]